MPNFTPVPEGRDWPPTAAPYTAGAHRDHVEQAITGLYWRTPQHGRIDGPLYPTSALQQYCMELDVPRRAVTGFAYDGQDTVLTYPDGDCPDGTETTTYGLLGVEIAFDNGSVRVYLLDTGTSLVPLALDFLPHGQTWPPNPQPPHTRAQRHADATEQGEGHEDG